MEAEGLYHGQVPVIKISTLDLTRALGFLEIRCERIE